MLAFAIKGNVINYIIITISMNICISQSTCMIAIKRLLLNVIIGITFIACALLCILPDPSYCFVLPYCLLLLLYFTVMLMCTA